MCGLVRYSFEKVFLTAMINDYNDVYGDWYSGVYDVPPSFLDAEYENYYYSECDGDASSIGLDQPLHDQNLPLA